MALSYRCWAEVSLDALRENLGWIRHRVGPDVRIMAVVKADAYGHGLKQIAALLMQSGADLFGVANLAEARAIRSVGKGWPILMLGACLPDEVETAVREEVMPTISTLEEAKRFSAVATRLKRPVQFQVKIDTGMGRLGAAPEQAAQLIPATAALPGLQLHGIYTHYAAAEDDRAISRRQQVRFRRALRPLEPFLKRTGPILLHANNSAGLLFEPKSIFNVVRPGLLMYGILPPGVRRAPTPWQRQVRPALAWKCRVSLVKTVPRGAGLSYGHSFVAPRELQVATLTAGYGDGYLRAGSNRANVLIGGRRCPVVGRITMDQMLVDVSALPGVPAGDEAVLIGKQGGEEITAREVAGWCQTVPWEVLTAITYRVPRIYQGAQAA